MTYNSLFRHDDFDERLVNVKHSDGNTQLLRPCDYYLLHEGSLESVLSDLESMTEIDLGEIDFRQKIIWGVPRIIRGVLDYNAATKVPTRSYNAPELVLTATQTAIDIYTNPLRISRAVREMRDYFSSNPSLDGILDTEVIQQGDCMTFESSSPRHSNYAVKCLLNEFKGKNLLFILSAHGGVPAGLDVFLKYQDSSRDGDSIVYPVRYSTDKLKDSRPRLRKTEVEYLKDTRKNRPVVIFDEDICGGETMRGMKRFFSDGIFPKSKIFVIANQCGVQTMKDLNGFCWDSGSRGIL